MAFILNTPDQQYLDYHDEEARRNDQSVFLENTIIRLHNLRR